MDNETEQANLRNISDWQRERRGRVDAYAAVLTHLNDAAAAVPYDDGVGHGLGAEIVHLAGKARGSLRRVLDEPNPFVERATDPDPALREAAASILRDAEEAGVGDVIALTTEGRIGSGGVNQPAYFDSVAQYVARNLRRALAR